ncbi:hypothetical protein ACFFWC_17305 [Plantactinospora siamensis]|uniref:Uncharacterized protein n=1 Tax=Plantactinospora siamensis TaxID=555372 RepID=A0ABV6NQU2_9ACTN
MSYPGPYPPAPQNAPTAAPAPGPHPGTAPGGYAQPVSPGGYPPPVSPGHPPVSPGQPYPGGYAQPAAPAYPGYAAPAQPGHGGPAHLGYAGPGYAEPAHAGYGVLPGQAYPATGPAPVNDPRAAGVPGLTCRLCGCAPAAKVTFRGHRGMVLIMQFLSMKGPFCHGCGLATFRSMTSKTLVQGWWGYFSFVITPIVVLYNLAVSGRVRRLAPPRPIPGAPSRAPLDPGPHLLVRPMTIIGLAIPLAVLILLFALAMNG